MTTPWILTPRQFCDLELLGNGAFAPLRGFLNRRDYESVLANARLATGELWPMPIVLDVDREVSGRLTLTDEDGTPLAVMTVEDVWQPDRVAEAEAVYGGAQEFTDGKANAKR